MASLDTSTVCLFDVDGTLTLPRQKITDEMESFMMKLKERVVVGLVGGSDLDKIEEQMSDGTKHVTERYDFVFSENGLVAHKKGKFLSKQVMVEHLGEEKSQRFINYALKYLSDLSLPCKRGTFIEFRSGLINVCPVGRSCSQAERDEFAAFDAKHNIRKNLVAKFQEEFSDMGLKFVIGGQISIDVFPAGWDKTAALRHIESDNFKTIHFFGDKTQPGGNDYEISIDERVKGHTVVGPEDTKKQLEDLFFS